MKTILLALLSCVGMAQAAELYRWVDSEGKIHYSDQMPSGTANVQKKNLGINVIQTSELPYSLQLAVKNNPATLYVSACGEACDKAREHLARRGVPYTAKNPETLADSEALKKLINSIEVPVLVLGSTPPLRGYHAGNWDKALDVAGYPKTNVLRNSQKKAEELRLKEAPKPPVKKPDSSQPPLSPGTTAY